MIYTSGLLVLVLSLIMLFAYWKHRWVEQKITSARWRRAWSVLEKACSIRFRNWWSSVVLPVVLVASLWVWLLFGKHLVLSGEYPGFFFIFMSLTFAAFFEEVLLRGIYFGVFFLFVPELKSRRHKWLKNYLFSIGMIGLITTSILFSLSHNFAIDLRYVSGVIFAVVYWVDKRNLLPAIIAHVLNNAISLGVTKFV